MVHAISDINHLDTKMTAIRDTSAQDKTIALPASQRTKKAALVAIGLLVVLAAGTMLIKTWSSSTRSVSMARLSIAPVVRATLTRDVLVNGRVVAAVSPTLYATASSTVTLKVNAGDSIKKGDIVAALESPDLSNTLKREQAIYEQLEAEVARQHILARKQKLLARRDADQAEIDRVAAQRTFQRLDKAGQAGVIAKLDYEKAKDTLKSAEIRAKHSELATVLENDDVDLTMKTKRSQLLQQKLVRDNAQRRVDELQLRAPVEGFVGTLSTTDGSVVAANAPLMTLVDLSQLEIQVEIPESFIADLGLGVQAEITINGSTFLGKLSALSPEVVNNQVLARVRFENSQPAGLRQSQRVSVRLLIEEKTNVLTLPRGSFMEHGGGRYAYVLQGGLATRRPIKLGATSIAAVEIVEGLNEGEKVVIAGSDSFEDAPTVSINK